MSWLVRVVEQLVPGLVEDATHTEDDEAEGNEAAVEPVEEDEGQQGGPREGPEPPDERQTDPRHDLDQQEVRTGALRLSPGGRLGAAGLSIHQFHFFFFFRVKSGGHYCH